MNSIESVHIPNIYLIMSEMAEYLKKAEIPDELLVEVKTISH